MFGTIRKHQTWLWAFIITAIIISFVYYFSPASKLNSSGRYSRGHGSINGEVVTDQQYLSAYRETDLHSFFMNGRWLAEDKKRSDQEVEREIYQWLLLVQQQERLGINVDDQAAAEMARQMLRSFERMGVTSPQIFVQKILQPHGLQVSDFERYMRHFVGLQELISTVGLGGRLVPQQEAESLYEREHQEVATSAVFFNASNYLAGVPVTPEAVSLFYSNRMSNYAIPERVAVSYVAFAATNFQAQAVAELGTNIPEIVESNFQRIGTNAATLFPEAKSTDEVKQKIRQQLIRQQAIGFARKQALDFATTLFDLKPVKPGNLWELAKTNGLEAAVTAPFDRDTGPKDIEAGADFTKAAFSLTLEEPFGGPIPGQEAIYVIAFNRQLPRETPALDQIRDRVTADYKRNQAMTMVRSTASAVHQILTNGLAQGKSLSNLCVQSSVTLTPLPPFSLSTRSLPEFEELINLNQLKQATISTGPDKITTPFPTSQGSMILYVKGKLPLDKEKMKADMPAFLNQVRRSRQQEAFDEWFRREGEKGLRDTPLSRPQPSTMGSAAKS